MDERDAARGMVVVVGSVDNYGCSGEAALIVSDGSYNSICH